MHPITGIQDLSIHGTSILQTPVRAPQTERGREQAYVRLDLSRVSCLVGVLHTFHEAKAESVILGFGSWASSHLSIGSTKLSLHSSCPMTSPTKEGNSNIFSAKNIISFNILFSDFDRRSRSQYKIVHFRTWSRRNIHDWICFYRNWMKPTCVSLVGKNMHRRICAEKSDLSSECLDKRLWSSLLTFTVVLLLRVSLANANGALVSILKK